MIKLVVWVLHKDIGIFVVRFGSDCVVNSTATHVTNIQYFVLF